MKRYKWLLFLVLVVILLFGKGVFAVDTASDVSGLNEVKEGVDNLENSVDELKDRAKELRENELFRAGKWGEWFKAKAEKNKFYYILVGTDSVLEALSPVFEALVNIKYSFSFIFFLTFFVWGFLVFNISGLIKEFFEDSPWSNFLVSLIVPALIARTGAINNVIGIFEPIITANFWYTLASTFFVIFLSYFVTKLVRHIAKRIKRAKENASAKERRGEMKVLKRVNKGKGGDDGTYEVLPSEVDRKVTRYEREGNSDDD